MGIMNDTPYYIVTVTMAVDGLVIWWAHCSSTTIDSARAECGIVVDGYSRLAEADGNAYEIKLTDYLGEEIENWSV